MNRQIKRDVLKTLIQAGRRDLAQAVTQVTAKDVWNEYASEFDDALNRSLGPLRNLKHDSKYGKDAARWEKDVMKLVDEVSKATTKYGAGDTPA